VGRNWRYLNDNGMSSAYRSLHINTSRRTMQYRTFPMPDAYPDYPHHNYRRVVHPDLQDLYFIGPPPAPRRD